MNARPSLPEPFSRIRIKVEPNPWTIAYFAQGTPEDLVASGIAKSEWIPPSRGGKQKQLPDGGHCFWMRRGKKARTWKLSFYFKSLEAARRMPGVPADIAFAEPEPEVSASCPKQQLTAAAWKARMMRSFMDTPMSVGTFAAGLSYPDYSWEDGRFTLDPCDAADLIRLEAACRAKFMERFASARIIDRQAAAPGLRLVVDNTRPEPRP